MRSVRLPLRLALCGLLWLLSCPVLAELVVIVNARAGVAAMTRGEVINVFFGRNRQFFNGVEALPVDLVDGHPDRERFYKALVGKEIADVNAYWSRQYFSGGVRPPGRMASPEEVVKWVASRPGGIGFVELGKADARVRVVYDVLP